MVASNSGPNVLPLLFCSLFERPGESFRKSVGLGSCNLERSNPRSTIRPFGLVRILPLNSSISYSIIFMPRNNTLSILQHRIFVFGGTTKTTYMNDLFVVDCSDTEFVAAAVHPKVMNRKSGLFSHSITRLMEVRPRPAPTTPAPRSRTVVSSFLVSF